MPPTITDHLRVLALLTAAVPMVACARVAPLAPRAQVLHLDAADPRAAMRCDVEVAADGASDHVKVVESGCSAWRGDALAPGSLSIDVRNRQPGVTYDLKVGQTSAGAAPEDIKAVLDEVVRRTLLLVKPMAKDSAAAAAAVAAAGAVAPQLTAALVARLAPATSSPRAAPAAIFRGYLIAGAPASLKAAAAARQAPARLDTLLNEPTDIAPPPRYYVLGADDEAYLSANAVPVGALPTMVDEWCSAASFQEPARAAEYAALAVPPADAALAQAFGLTEDDLVAIISGRASAAPLQARVKALTDAANSLPWPSLDAAQRAFLLMRHGTTLVRLIDNCVANLALVEHAVPPGLTTLRAHAKAHADALVRIMGPLLRGALPKAEAIATASAGGDFGTFPLTPGALELTFGASRDNQHVELGTYKADVQGVPRFALVIGPAVTTCANRWGCFDTLEEYTEGPTRGVARRRAQVDYSIATALHITLRSWRNHGVGALVGYPVGTPSATSYNVLLGLGWRHRAGIEIGVGAHVFRRPDLKPPYAARTPFVLADSLTIDAITDDRLRAGVFFMIGLEPALFSKL